MTAHVKHLILAGVIAACVLLLAWKIIAHMDGVAHDKRVLAEDKLKQDKQAQSAAENQAAQDRKAYDLLKSQLDVQNAQLRGQITALVASLAARQQQDRALPLPELGQRLSGQIGAIPGDVKPVPDGLFVSDDAARKAVVLLDELPSDRETIGAQAKLIENKDLELKYAHDLQASGDRALDACKETQVSADTACNARIAEVKAKARKHGMIYNLLSLAAGIVLGHRL